jgi:hypothetical protein
MSPRDLSASDIKEWREFIRGVFLEIPPKEKKSIALPNVCPKMVEFVGLYFSSTFDNEMLGYELPWDLYSSLPDMPKLTRLEFTRRFGRTCRVAPHLGVVEPARTSEMKGLRWVRFATDAEIRERRTSKD